MRGCDYSLHRLCDYYAEITSDDRLIASPERTAGRRWPCPAGRFPPGFRRRGAVGC